MCKKQRTAFEESFKMKTSQRKWEIWNFYLYFKESYAYFKEKYLYLDLISPFICF